MVGQAPRGYLAIVLHAHLPFIRHPEHRAYLEERWLYEAITECYLPLLIRFRRLRADGVAFRLTMSLTPPLLAMLRDDLLKTRYIEHLMALEELARAEMHRRPEPHVRYLARLYLERFSEMHALWDEIRGDLAEALAELEREGFLEIMTCAATHGYLPLLSAHPECVRAQLAVAVQHHREQLGVAPRGIWLPECAYEPGLEEVLADHGLRFFLVDTHAVEHASAVPRWGVYAPVYCPNGVAAFGRDPESSRQVWSAESGYPGDFWYRDFYRDIGFDIPVSELGRAAHPDGIRVATGIKYHRITEKGDYKEWYEPRAALEHAAEHAGNFLFNRQHQVRWLGGALDRPPLVVAPYDAELFGHWWYEGPDFLELLFRKLHFDQDEVQPITLAEYLRRHPVNQVVVPSPSSWGAGGYNYVWIEGANAWVYRHLHLAADDMIRLARSHPSPDDLARRALNQAARELLLAQSSDWTFIMMTRTSVEFAVKRIKAHLSRFRRLVREIDSGDIDVGWLGDLEWRDNVFPSLDYRVFG
jgi:1,4-alpha-glucan branching enzyme